MASQASQTHETQVKVSDKTSAFHYSILVFAGGVILTFLLWDAYLRSTTSEIEQKVASPLILIMGSLFSLAAGLFVYSLETRGSFLRREVQKRTLELEAKNQQLIEKNKEIENFIHIISHDLKAPLVSIHGFVSLLKTELGSPLEGTKADYLNRIMANAKQMSSFLQDLLEFSRVGRIEDEKKEVDLGLVVKEILAALKPEIDKKQIAVESSKNFPKLWGAPNRIHQVFANLIGNSVKYIGNGSQPKLVIGYQENSNGFYQITIRDNGIGIPREAHSKVFQIFQRFHPSSEIEGTGVGLSIVKKIVDHNGGHVWFESEVGQGTTFFVTWPRH